MSVYLRLATIFLLVLCYQGAAQADTDGGEDSPFDVTQFPAACHGLSRDNKLLDIMKLPKNYMKNNYAAIQNVRNRDIVCMGDELEINTPIYSNGGDVFIYAKTLTLKSNIDTRTYRPFVFQSLFIQPGGSSP